MKTIAIDIKELKNNLDYYIEVGKKTIIEVTKDGKGVTIGNGGFIPTKVFKGVTYDLKQNGAKYDAKTKVWSFETKKACTEWCKRQDARG